MSLTTRLLILIVPQILVVPVVGALNVSGVSNVEMEGLTGILSLLMFAGSSMALLITPAFGFAPGTFRHLVNIFGIQFILTQIIGGTAFYGLIKESSSVQVMAFIFGNAIYAAVLFLACRDANTRETL